MNKYEPLSRYLLALPPAIDDKTLSFREIEGILGSKLPASAHSYRAWWSNPSSPKDHPHAQAWLGAGWTVESVNPDAQWVRFRRTGLAAVAKEAATAAETNVAGLEQGVATGGRGAASGTSGKDSLYVLGFEEVGEWVFERGALQFSLTQCGHERDLLYAFVVCGEVKYIGKSSRTLEQRLNGYRQPGPTQRTNLRIRPVIEEQLRQGMRVQILALVQREEILYRSVPLSLAGGLEDALIARFNPPWNILR